MNNTHKKLQDILKRERKVPKDIETLYQKLYDNIHGNTNINTQATKKLIHKIVQENKIDNSEVTDIEIRENKPNSCYLHITLSIEGKYNGRINFETWSGTKTSTGEDIYYIPSVERYYKSDLEKKILEYYKNTYPRLIEELFLDIAIDRKKYLKLDTTNNKYELWDREPSKYSDTMQGEYFDRRKPINSYYKYENLGKIFNHKTIRDFGNKSDWSNWTTETIEWKRYYI